MAPDIVKQLFEYHVNMHQQALMGGMVPTMGAAPGEELPQVPGQQQPQAVEGQEPAPAGGETNTPSNTQPPGQGN